MSYSIRHHLPYYIRHHLSHHHALDYIVYHHAFYDIILHHITSRVRGAVHRACQTHQIHRRLRLRTRGVRAPAELPRAPHRRTRSASQDTLRQARAPAAGPGPIPGRARAGGHGGAQHRLACQTAKQRGAVQWFARSVQSPTAGCRATAPTHADRGTHARAHARANTQAGRPGPSRARPAHLQVWVGLARLGPPKTPRVDAVHGVEHAVPHRHEGGKSAERRQRRDRAWVRTSRARPPHPRPRRPPEEPRTRCERLHGCASFFTEKTKMGDVTNPVPTLTPRVAATMEASSYGSCQGAAPRAPAGSRR